MKQTHHRWPLLLLLAVAPMAAATDGYFEVSCPPSDKPSELQFAATYTLWVPGGVQKLRGIIVHQHGCGAGSSKSGMTAAHDLHWQALARKWDCALLGPSYHQEDNQNCRLWCDPRNGSEKTFLRALKDLAAQAQHPELDRVPWCLWGHSGGGFWSSLMQTLHPDRIVAIWFRSGTAFEVWGRGEIPKPQIPQAAYQVPMMCNPGAKENGDKRFNGAWTGTRAMFQAYRAAGAPIGFAPDPRTSHECGDSRYLAIPFFDACLAMRLPPKGSTDQTLKPVPMNQAWLAELGGDRVEPAASFRGQAEGSVWLPNESFAKAWSEYVKTGAVSDPTPPPAPVSIKAAVKPDHSVEISWEAAADFESGLAGFIIQRDGQELIRLPQKPKGTFGRPLFQVMSYGDTPQPPMPDMRFVDTTAQPGTFHEYRVRALNSVGLASEPSQPAVTR